MSKGEDSLLLSPETQEKNVKAEIHLRGLLASYPYSSPATTPQSLPRRSPRNLSSSSFSAPHHASLKAEDHKVTLPLTPTSLVKRRVASSSSTKKRKLEAEDDDALPLPLLPDERTMTSAPRSKGSKKQKRSYAPPETYAHLQGLPDHLAFGLDGQ